MRPDRAFFGFSGVLGLSVLLPLPNASGLVAHIPAFCPFYLLSGLPCPGCGLTRAFVCLGHGHFLESLHWNPLGWLLFSLCVFLWLRAGLFWARHQPTLPPLPHAGRLSWSLTVLIVSVGAARIGWLTTHHLRF